MGTRADFYIGKDKDAEWLGSSAYDGYPDGPEVSGLFLATDEATFRQKLAVYSQREDWTAPEDGWPWPWEDSRTTDWAYAFADGQVWMSAFGRPYVPAQSDPPEDIRDSAREQEFPRYGGRPQAVTLGPRSGLLILG